MMYLTMLLAGIVFSPIGVYFYFFLKRILSLFMKKIDKLTKVVLILISITIVLFSCNPFGVGIVIFAHLFVFSILMDLIVLIVNKIKKRKIVLLDKVHRSGIVSISLTIILLVFAYFNMTNVKMKEYEIVTAKSLENDYKIVFLSDLHFGTTMNNDTLESYVSSISELNADAVILGGDIVDENTGRDGMLEVFSTLGKIESKYGVFFVYGNHDKAKYYSDRKYTDEELATAIERSGITALVDDNYIINDELVLIGRDDTNFPQGDIRKSTNELVEGLDRDDFWLVIDHHPYDLKDNADVGYDLQLSGHTHGGQIFPTGLVTEIFDSESLNYGCRKIDNFTAIVTSGMGGWAYPFRTGTNSEYIVVNISNEK